MPDTALLLLIVVIVLGLGFDYINGFHDTANAIATAVATRVLSPGRAVAMAAVLNFVGALTGTAVATTVGKGLIDPAQTSQLLVVAALLAAIVWDLLTWWYGIPSSSSHALVFSIVGAGVAKAGRGVILFGGLEKTFRGLVFSPLLGFAGAFLVMFGLLWLCARAHPRQVTRIFGRLQIVSAAWMAYSHGGNDAQKTMGVITMALASYYGWTGSDWQVPLWVIIAAATAMALGTGIGGWRIIRTMGLKVVKLRPIDGFAAETAAGTILEVASRLGIPVSTTHVISSAIPVSTTHVISSAIPVSTTHVISSAILGVGATKHLSAVRCGIAGRIIVAWIVTLPACAAFGWAFYQVLRLATGLR